MNYLNVVKIALNALKHNKFRAVLTMLGIIIGVASVIAMLSIGQGSKKSIQDQISAMGTNMIFIRPGDDGRGPGGGASQNSANIQTLELSDVDAIRQSCSAISAISPVVNSGGQAVKGNSNWPTSMYGVNANTN